MLTIEQQSAIESDASRILVRAGAGSGKTEVMTRRIIHLMERDPQLSLRNIAIITFTNKATENSKSRIRKQLYAKWLGSQDQGTKERFRRELDTLNLAQISTIHQFCRVILDMAGPLIIEDHFQYAPTFSIDNNLVSKAADQVVQRWMGEEEGIQVLTKHWPAHEIRSFILDLYTSIQNKGLEIEDLVAKTKRSALLIEQGEPAKIKRVFAELLKELRTVEMKLRVSSLSIEHLLEYAARALQQNAWLVKRVQRKFSHIFVDEFQDTSLFQTHILKLICDTGDSPSSLFVVGDIKQSIYQFRGADLQSYKSVEAWIEQTGTVMTLKTNFRSIKPIIDYINWTFKLIQQDAKKPIFETEDLISNDISPQSVEEAVKVVLLQNFKPEERIANLIEEEVAKGASYGEFAVLFRTNHLMEAFYLELESRGIPAQLIGAGNFYSFGEIKDMYRLLNWLLTPEDPIKRLEALESKLINNEERLLNELQESMFSNMTEFSPAQMIEEILKITDARQRYAEEGNLQAIANLERLKEITREIKAEIQLQLVDYLNWFSSQIRFNRDEGHAVISDKAHTAVQLITIHRAKGLEFPRVILVELDRNLDSQGLMPEFQFDEENGIEFKLRLSDYKEGIFISSKGYENLYTDYMKEFLSEEARILYVALSRAEKKLYLLVNDKVNRQNTYQNWLWKP